MAWKVESARGIFLPQIGWHLDATRSVPRSFVSHAHSDHIARHKAVLCTRATARLMAARLPGRREEIILPFDTAHTLEDGTRVTLHPAGHVLGSAQWRAENEHGALLYTGDFKLRAGFSTEACATPPADTLIMETTFGRPQYAFPPAEETMAGIVAFCRDALERGAVPLLFCYSLGKSQEVLAGLRGANLPVMLHAEAWKITRIYEELGASFPAYGKFEADEARGHVVICPPQSGRAAWLERLGPHRTAAVTGWAVERSTLYRTRCDAVFPLSDHADFADLLRFVELVAPKRVFTVHGFAADFARELRTRGIEAWALGIENQLEMGFVPPTPAFPHAGQGGEQ